MINNKKKERCVDSIVFSSVGKLTNCKLVIYELIGDKPYKVFDSEDRMLLPSYSEILVVTVKDGYVVETEKRCCNE